MDPARNLFNHHRPGSSGCRPWWNIKHHRGSLRADCRCFVPDQPLTSISFWSTVSHQEAVLLYWTLSLFCYPLSLKLDQEVKNVPRKSDGCHQDYSKEGSLVWIDYPGLDRAMAAQFLRSVNLSRHPAHRRFHLHAIRSYCCLDYYEIPVVVIAPTLSFFWRSSLFSANA